MSRSSFSNRFLVIILTIAAKVATMYVALACLFFMIVHYYFKIMARRGRFLIGYSFGRFATISAYFPIPNPAEPCGFYLASHLGFEPRTYWLTTSYSDH